MKVVFQKFKNGIVKVSKSVLRSGKIKKEKRLKYQALKLEKQKRKNLEKSLNLKKNIAYVNSSNLNNTQIDYFSNKYNKRTYSNNSKMFDFKAIDSFINDYLCNQSFKLNFINILLLSLMFVLILLNNGIE